MQQTTWQALGGGIAVLMLWCAPGVWAQENHLVIFDFEENTQEWTIPNWTLESEDYVGDTLMLSRDFVSSGQGSLQLMTKFPGGKWMGAYVERMMYVTDWSPFEAIAVDVYLPYNAPKGLGGRLILTVGEDWTWTEVNRAKALVPDQWTTLQAKIAPGSLDWKFFLDEEFRKDVRKIGVRIESEGNVYNGPIYIDNVRLLNNSR